MKRVARRVFNRKEKFISLFGEDCIAIEHIGAHLYKG